MKNQLFFLLAILIFISTLPAHAQYDPDKVNKKAASLYSKALDMSADDLPGAIRLLQQAAQIDANYEDAYLSIAGMYAQLKEYRHSIDNYEKARSIDSNYFRDFNLPYSIGLAGIGDFAKALDAVKTFLTEPNLSETSRKAGEY